MRERLLTLLSDVLQRDELPAFEECSADRLTDWDSVAHLNLILSVEAEFDVAFPMNTIVEMNSLGAIETEIENQGKK